MRRATFVTAIYVEMAGRKKKTSRFAKRPQASSREPMNGRSLGDRKKKTPRKKNRGAFSPDGPNRARLRHAACEATYEPVPSYFVGGNPPHSGAIIVSLSHSSSLRRRGKTAEGWAPSFSVTGEKL